MSDIEYLYIQVIVIGFQIRNGHQEAINMQLLAYVLGGCFNVEIPCK